MQEAIKKFIDIQCLLGKPLHKTEDEIIKVERIEIQKARKKQYKEWRIKR